MTLVRSARLLTIPWSVGQSLSPLVVLEVDPARAQVHAVLHRDGSVDERSNLLQLWFSALHDFLGIGNVEAVGRQMSFHWGFQPA